MGGILWVSYLVQRQVGGDDQRLPAAISAVYDIQQRLLRCKILVGDTQTLELHPLDAGLASPNEKVYDSNTLAAIGKQLFPVKKENSND